MMERLIQNSQNKKFIQNDQAPQATGEFDSKDNLSALAAHYRKEQLLAPRTKQMDSHIVSLLKPASMEAEQYRRLRYSVEQIPETSGGRVLGVTSPLPGDGKSMTALNLAGSLAQNPGASVLLLELDLHQPNKGIRDYLGIRKEAKNGVVDWVSDTKATLKDTTYFMPSFNLYLMPSGNSRVSPYQIFSSPRFAELFKALRERHDYVVVDTSPAVLMAENRLLTSLIDTYVIVVAAGCTPREMLAETLDGMEPDKVLGLVFNRNPVTYERYYGAG